MSNKDVFISYKAEESEEAIWVKSVLESNGISCWMAPSSIPGGSNYAIEIPQAIKNSKVFVLILSSKAQDSQWVSREVDLAINVGKIVLPFMLENCTLKDDFNFYLTNVQRYAAYENKVAAIEKMLKEIKALVNTEDNEQSFEEKIEVTPKSVSKNVQKQHKLKYDIFCILSMVLGIVAMLALGGLFIIPSIVSIVFAIVGLNNLRKKPNVKAKRFAVSGLVLGILSIILGVIQWIVIMS